MIHNNILYKKIGEVEPEDMANIPKKCGEALS